MAVGFRHYDPKVRTTGIVINRAGSERRQSGDSDQLFRADCRAHGRRRTPIQRDAEHFGQGRLAAIARPWCGAEMAPSITHIIAAPKPSASTSSPHHGRSSLRLVWVSLRYWVRSTNRTTQRKVLEFSSTTIYNYYRLVWATSKSIATSYIFNFRN